MGSEAAISLHSVESGVQRDVGGRGGADSLDSLGEGARWGVGAVNLARLARLGGCVGGQKAVGGRAGADSLLSLGEGSESGLEARQLARLGRLLLLSDLS